MCSKEAETEESDSFFTGVVESVKEAYDFSEPKERRQVPFIYYVSEAGLMAGDFYYNTDLFDNNTKITSVFLYTPIDNMYANFTDMKDYPLTDKLKLGGRIKVIKYTDIRTSTIGNYSDNEEIPEEYLEYLKQGKFEEIDDPDKLNGYRLSEGRNSKIGFNATYEIDEKNSLITQYTYEELRRESNWDYKSDTIFLAWENKNIDLKNNPRQGYKVITKAEKSLDWLGHDEHNNWDYQKYTVDLRKFFPVFEESTLAVRFRTQHTRGEKVKDEMASLLRQAQTGDEDAEVYTYAPFFDMAILGDLQTMKGYYYYRFYDNNSVLYQTEFRFPLDHIYPRLQGNIFAEAGRVGSDYNTDLFTKDMHYSGGFGLRYFFNQDVVVRGDIGISEEESRFRMSVGQTF